MPPNPACRSLTRQDFKVVFQTALRSLSNRSIVVVGNYCSSPITAEQYREKTRPLRPRRSCFAPAETRRLGRALVEAPGTAPGSEWFIATAIYFHSRRTGTPNIGAKWSKRQWRNGRIRRIFRNGRIRDETATERYQTESPGAAIPRPLSAFGPIFLQNCTLYWGCRFAGYGNK